MESPYSRWFERKTSFRWMPEVRADLVYRRNPEGGGFFSTGSIAWAGSHSHDDYDNNISRITGNVLDAFASDGSLPD